MYVRVKAKTGAKKDKIRCISKTTFEISVKEKPIKNRANQRIIEVLASHLRIPSKSVRLINGHHGPSKMYIVDKD